MNYFYDYLLVLICFYSFEFNPRFMINVLADENLTNISHFIPESCELSFFKPDQGLHIPDGTQALLIRSVTDINPKNTPDLPESLEFVATGSAGTDHVDKDYLAAHKIALKDAAGSNARSVAEYVAVAMLLWGQERDYDLSKLTVGIIGAGHTGTAVKTLLGQLNIQTVVYDPPREEREAQFQTATRQDLLDCDVITFHTPLTYDTDYPTFHWLSKKILEHHRFKLVINASRGCVVDEEALVQAFEAGTVENFVLDVWENEPVFNDATARRAYIKTPHIAGYSRQAKQAASKMIVESLANYFGLDDDIPTVKATPQTHQLPRKFWSLTDILTFYHPILDYETRFRMLTGRNDKSKAEGFHTIRRTHPLRDEFNRLKAPSGLVTKFPVLGQLGFECE